MSTIEYRLLDKFFPQNMASRENRQYVPYVYGGFQRATAVFFLMGDSFFLKNLRWY